MPCDVLFLQPSYYMLFPCYTWNSYSSGKIFFPCIRLICLFICFFNIGRTNIRQGLKIWNKPRFRTISEISIRKKDNRRSVFQSYFHRLESCRKTIGRRLSRDDRYRGFSVSSIYSLEKVCLLCFSRQPRRGTSPLDIDNYHRKF